MKGLFIINPSSGKQNIDSMLREIMATLILDQICSHVDVFYTKGKDDAKNRAAELKPGDYVVHANHGIGVFKGIKQIDIAGNTRDYLDIVYEFCLYLLVVTVRQMKLRMWSDLK